jgi:hypothetical protein
VRASAIIFNLPIANKNLEFQHIIQTSDERNKVSNARNMFILPSSSIALIHLKWIVIEYYKGGYNSPPERLFDRKIENVSGKETCVNTMNE